MKTGWFVLTGLLLSQLLTAQAPLLDFQQVALSGPALVDPTDITGSGDGSGRLFVCEKRGTVRIIQNGAVQAGFFMDLRPNIATSGEAGLLGITFHPDFPGTPYVYVNYIKPTLITWVSRFTVSAVNPDTVIAGSELTVLEVDQPFDNHNAGDLAFGPDGYLYISLGDGGSGGDPFENGQDPAELLGKMLRIDVDGGTPYAIPPDNPFVGVPGYQEEIWALGMRNPWRFSFDRQTGDLWIADVGQGLWEELDFEPAGSGGGINYGWDCYEGDAEYESTDCSGPSEYQFPIFVYPHSCSQGGCPYGTGNSITGGFVYRGSQFPAMQGYYICADYVSENIWVITSDGSTTEITLQSGAGLFNQLTTFGEDDNGELYAAALDDHLYRVVPDGFLPVYLTNFDAAVQADEVLLQWSLESVSDVQKFTIERSANGVYFKTLATVPVSHEQRHYQWKDHPADHALYYYRLVLALQDGAAQVSQVRTADLREKGHQVRLSTLVNGALAVILSGADQSADVEMLTHDGRSLIQQQSSQQFIEIEQSATLPPGVYIVVVRTLSGSRTFKWLKAK